MSDNSLYSRIGGAPAVQAAVDLFYDKVLAEPSLAPFFENISMDRLKSHQFAFLSQAMGGPQKYSGASMKAAHSRLPIQQYHFDLVATHLVETLRELGVPEENIAEVVAAIAPLASQIVNTASQPTMA